MLADPTARAAYDAHLLEQEAWHSSGPAGRPGTAGPEESPAGGWNVSRVGWSASFNKPIPIFSPASPATSRRSSPHARPDITTESSSYTCRPERRPQVAPPSSPCRCAFCAQPAAGWPDWDASGAVAVNSLARSTNRPAFASASPERFRTASWPPRW